MSEPCSLNSTLWRLSDQYCKECGHTGWMHPGGGGNNLEACLICITVDLHRALEHRIAEVGRVAYDARRVAALGVAHR